MKHYALIGRTLVHSHSKLLFDRQHFDGADYQLHEMECIDGVRVWAKEEAMAGFNVTNPFKQSILPLLDAVDDEARAIGAVNCVSVEGNRLVGHNTDAPAFRHTLPPLPPLDSVLVLGTGGAARAVMYALRTMGLEATMVSRTPERHTAALGYGEARQRLEQSAHALLVNATPVGTYPAVNQSPWPWRLHAGVVVYDLVYNPSPTLLLAQAAEQGCTVVGGDAMLQRQAELSWHLWKLR